jgi:hypothetical protein
MILVGPCILVSEAMWVVSGILGVAMWITRDSAELDSTMLLAAANCPEMAYRLDGNRCDSACGVAVDRVHSHVSGNLASYYGNGRGL